MTRERQKDIYKSAHILDLLKRRFAIKKICLIFPIRRGGRVAEGGGLLNRYTGTTCIVGSNPISSAIFIFTGIHSLKNSNSQKVIQKPTIIMGVRHPAALLLSARGAPRPNPTSSASQSFKTAVRRSASYVGGQIAPHKKTAPKGAALKYLK